MINLTNKEYKEFIHVNVLPELNFEEINKNNIYDIYDFIVECYEIPYIEKNSSKLEFIDALLNYLAQFMDFTE